MDNIKVIDDFFDPLTLKILNDKIPLLQWGFHEVISESDGHPVERFMTNNVYNVILPLIVPLRHITDTYEVSNNIQKNNYKLYRKSALPTEKKSITDSMNLIINNS